MDANVLTALEATRRVALEKLRMVFCDVCEADCGEANCWDEVRIGETRHWRPLDGFHEARVIYAEQFWAEP